MAAARKAGQTQREAAADAPLLEGLPPILDAGVETLFLGSFPSPASLAAAGYYAHPQNQFWRLLAALTGDDALIEPDYRERRRRLLARRIGVWDLYRHCRREGALDAAIADAVRNDFSRLAAEAPRLVRVFFNGKTAARGEAWFRQHGFVTAVLPSSSPALTLPFALKLERWRAAWEAADAV